MTELETRDYGRMLDLAVALLESLDPDWSLATAELNEVLHGGLCLFLDDIRFTRRSGFVRAWAPATPRLDRLSWDMLLRANMGAHPIAAYYAGCTDRTPVSIEDVAGPGHWPRTTTYRTMQTLFEVNDQIALPLRAPTGAVRSFLVCRPTGESVTDHDRLYARRIQPLLVRVDSHLRELQRLRATVPDPPQPLRRAEEHGITPRELTVLSLLAEGLTTASIAGRLSISVHTANTHLERLYRKLGTTNRLTTVLTARELGLIAEP
ncbi:response regulator transcription factor [Streptomyces pseudovenezuelae]|uniref:response regulator transcription factor n=1 Tax=Streptomyces pseudovenezuelae TaxID=67350 RepID=UPI002E380EB0|nr:LuxR C-terminal-related transcriptional regulator [Streptomyces pseudovenezuelae]